MSRNPDIVVVGAGAAGVGAGLALMRSGIPFLIIEAKERMGGRAYTDRTSLGIPWDHGCHWFHSADRNPLRHLADRIGHGYQPEPRGLKAPLFANGRWDMTGEARLHVWDELDRIVAEQRDVPAEEVIEADDPLADMVRHWVTLMSSGEAREVSALDYGRYDDTHINLPVRDGYGRLIEKIAQGLPIRLNCPARRIGWGAKGCEIETPQGTLKPAAVVVTASVNVLRSESIAFSPALPSELSSALDDVRCGFYEKIVIAFDGDPFEGFEAEFCDILDPHGSHPMNLEVRPHGRPIAIGHMAGDFARDMAAEGEIGMVEFVKEKLIAAFGNDIGKHVRGAATTRWGADPYIRGGYAYAKAGRASSRDAMIAADPAPLYLAGEAFHPFWAATAHGAYLTGIEAAHKAARRLGRDLDPDPLWLPETAVAPETAQQLLGASSGR